MTKFPNGRILVTRQALPRWAPLLNGAAALVTEQGTVAGHLATVARELRIPALFNVTDVMNILRNGDEITVDTDASAIYKGRLTAPVTDSRVKRDIIEEGPVYNTLKKASRTIVPLNLSDPDSREFAPTNC